MREATEALAAWLAGAEAWQAVLVLSSLAVGGAKKLEWGARLSLAGLLLAWRGAAWLCTPRPVHPGVKAALEAVSDPAASMLCEGDGDRFVRFGLGRLRIRCDRDRREASVWLDGEPVGSLFSAAEIRRILAACEKEYVRREKEKAKAAEAERLLARQILAESLQGGCPCGEACDCDPCDCGPKPKKQ